MQYVYLGGSITNGTGASVAESTSWRALVRAWILANYASKTQTHVNAGVGGTSSWYALVRLATDVAAYAPGLVTVDFAVNDFSPDAYIYTAEALIRRLITECAGVKLLGLLMLQVADRLVNDATNVQATSYARWLALFEHYGIAYADFAAEVQRAVAAAEHTVADYLSDNVHPNDLGHSTTAALAEAQLPAVLAGTAAALATRLHAESEDYENTPIIRYGTDNDGETGTWTTQATTARQSTVADSTIAWTATCQSFGIDSNLGAGAGTVAWSVDGGDYTNVDLSALGQTYQLLWSGARASHTITLKVISGTVRVNRFLAV